MPRLADTAYLVRETSGGFIAFVPVAPALWVRTSWCVLVVRCPQCKAKVGAACRGETGDSTSYTHYKRRDAARALPRAKKKAALENAIPGVAVSVVLLQSLEEK